MNRNDLISRSFYYEGEYHRIIKSFNNQRNYPSVDIKNVITIYDDIYPKEFLNLRCPPIVLYYKGDLNLLKKEKISIVGSRKACDYALRATEYLCLKNKDKVIVSGLAKGIDGKAHECAKKTIAILGCGIDYIYPKSNEYLYKIIEREGLILSEYPGLVKPLPYHFPFRNRLIAALGDCLYVMQSSNKSGTSSSVDEALELGKDVKVLPYDIFSPFGIHNNEMISEGAEIIQI